MSAQLEAAGTARVRQPQRTTYVAMANLVVAQQLLRHLHDRRPAPFKQIDDLRKLARPFGHSMRWPIIG
jgi:hypothetical protein